MHILSTSAILLILATSALALAIAFGGPATPPSMGTIVNPFSQQDRSSVPPILRFPARDGARLAYRKYPARALPERGSVVLIHGSSASSVSMHTLAEGLAAAGYTAYALDIRGHGDSGRHGSIDHVGQLEDDLEDFMRAVDPPGATTLAGFSSGGGFALRFAAGARQTLFANYLLLSPFISPYSPTQKPDSGGWVRMGVARIIAVSLLNRLGITLFNELPIARFALDANAAKLLTPWYSYALVQNFRPRDDYLADLRAAHQPMEVLAGSADEAFHADRFAALFANTQPPAPVILVPDIGHIPLILEPVAIREAVAALGRLHHAVGARRVSGS